MVETYKRPNGEEAALYISRSLNCFGNRETMEEFITTMDSEHRTLQQYFTGLCLSWLCHLSHISHYDARNEASVQVARDIDKAINLDERKRLPCI